MMTKPVAVTSMMPTTTEMNSRGMIKIPRLTDSVFVPATSGTEAAEKILV